MSGLFFSSPLFAEKNISEKSLPEDTIIEEQYQAGSGLPVGKIQSLRGDVIIFHDDPAVGFRARTGLPLYQGDTIRTQNNARIKGQLIDGSKFVLMPNSNLTILRCSFNSARKSSLSFLTFTQGEALFLVKESTELSSFDFKIQTDIIFAQVKDADFIVKADSVQTEILTFEESRLEATNLEDPERIIFVSEFQRLVAVSELGDPIIENLSPMDAGAIKAEYQLKPQSKLFDSSPDKYLKDRQGELTDESAEIEYNAIDEDQIDEP
jgi:hypothetical protein